MTPEEAIETAKRVKEMAVAESDDGDLCPSVVCVRAGNPVARVMLNGNSERFIQGTAIAAPAFGADMVILITDAYQSTEKYARERGEAKPGQLSRLWEQGRKDLVTETLSVCWGNREGEVWATACPYVRTGSTVEWKEQTPLLGGKELGGFIPDGIRKIVGRIWEDDVESQLEYLGIPELLDLGPVEARAHADAAAAKFLAAKGLPTLLMAFDDTSADVFKRSFGIEES